MSALNLIKDNITILGIKGILKVLYSRLFIIFEKKHPKIGYFFLEKKHNIMRRFLKKIDNESISENIVCIPLKEECLNNTIWVFWWQGEEKAPLVVKRCITSIKRHTPGYNTIIISHKNLQDYINLPENILSKVGKTLSYTQFSDLVRLALLSSYGGGWIDATLMLTKDLPLEIKDCPFFTIKNKVKPFFCVSNYRWTNGFIFVNKNIPIIRDLYRLFLYYWEHHNDRIDYFLLDYCWDYLYEKEKSYKDLIDNVKESNPRMFEDGFLKYADLPYNADLYNCILEDTWCHKLTYKQAFLNNNNTMLNHLLNVYA